MSDKSMEALKRIREAGNNTTEWATWAQRMAAWGMQPDRWPYPGDDPPGVRAELAKESKQ